MNVDKWKVMSEVLKKKKKKRHHSGSSNNSEAPNKRIKVELSDTADDSVVLSPPPVGLDCDSSVVECQRKKKKHKHHRADGVDVNIAGHSNVEFNQTSTDGQYTVSAVSVEHQTYVSGLKKCSSHKRTEHVEQQEIPWQHQTVVHSNPTVDRLCPPELRYYYMTRKCCMHNVVMHIICS